MMIPKGAMIFGRRNSPESRQVRRARLRREGFAGMDRSIFRGAPRDVRRTLARRRAVLMWRVG